MEVFFRFHSVADWPKLAWVAEWRADEEKLIVRHGGCAELSNEWIVEGVWDEPFENGDFDKTDIFFGSGIRYRAGKYIFVPSASMFDRILYLKKKNSVFFSNTLPGILAVTDSALIFEYDNYSFDSVSVTKGINGRVNKIPVRGGFVFSVYYNNLVFEKDTEKIYEINKIDKSPNFENFEIYKSYLSDTSNRLGLNADSRIRNHKINLLSGISSGYDSAVAAVVAKAAGCTGTVTISKASSVWGRSDSGAHIAERLNLECREYPRVTKDFKDEMKLWAGEGRPGVLNWTIFDYPEPLCLFFSGCHGEKVWDRVDHDHPDPFVRRDTSAHGFLEYRLWRGVFHCPVPFWGIRHSREIRKITESEEMRPWYMNLDYDKPIARRIVEEAGVPRNFFGMQNKNTSLESAFRWPISKRAMADFNKFLSENNINTYSLTLLNMFRKFINLRHLIHLNIGSKVKLRHSEDFSKKIPGYFKVFCWSNSRLAKIYRDAFLKTEG